MKTKILPTLAILFLLITIPTVSAEIDWSEPTTVIFTILGQGGEDNGDDIIEPTPHFCDGNHDDHMGFEDNYRKEIGDWTCINNRLQRTNNIYGKSVTEYGQVCGFQLEASKTISSNYILGIIALILGILIIIALILILLVLVKR